MFRYSTLALALLISTPALWQAFVVGDLDPTTALIRFLIAVPVAAVLLAVPRAVYSHYARNRAVAPVHVEATRVDVRESDTTLS